MTKISIVIPVYNASEYLTECLQSVLEQSISDLEIICINDGSTDKSLFILEEFAKKDARIIIINQRNQGVSVARNAGLLIVKGTFVGFVDADDTIEKDFFDKLYRAAKEYQCDIVFSKLSKNENYLDGSRMYNKNEIIQRILPLYLEKDILNSIWNKLYLYSLIKEHKIQFPAGKKLGEDADFNLQFLEFTENLYYLNYSGYNYREVSGSATRNVAAQNYLKEAVQLFTDESRAFVTNNLSSEKIDLLKSVRLIHYIMSLVYIYSEPRNGISVMHKIKKLNILVNNEIVAKVFSAKSSADFPDFSRYQKQIYNFIKSKGIVPLYVLSLYSYYRNL